jgi:hypothetical protein
VATARRMRWRLRSAPFHERLGARIFDRTMLCYHGRMGRWLVVVVLACLGSFGCRQSVEEDCRAMCEWADDCGEPEPGCFDNCIENMKGADDECRDALGDFAGCIEDREDCDDDDCDGEAVILFGECIDEFS